MTRCENCDRQSRETVSDAILRFGADEANREKLAAWLGTSVAKGIHVSPVSLDDTFDHVLSKFGGPRQVVAALDDGRLVFYSVTQLRTEVFG